MTDAPMSRDVLEAIFGRGFLVAIAALIAYSIRSDQRAQIRLAQGVCTRCGRQHPTTSLSDGKRSVKMCGECARITNRNHWAGYYFFLATGVVIALPALAFLAVDVYRGHRLPDSWMLLTLASPFAVAWWIRHRIERAGD